MPSRRCPAHWAGHPFGRRQPPTPGAFALAPAHRQGRYRDARRARSRNAPSRSLVPLEVRELIAMATTIGASRLPARASTAGERRGDVVQRSNEAYLLFARVASELIPGGAEHLKRLLQGREGVGRRRAACLLFGGGLEAPGGLDDVGRPVVERTWAVHAVIVVAPCVADHGAQCPKRPTPAPIRSVTWMEARTRINAHNDALPPPCAPATIKGRPTNGPNTATRWITQKGRTAT
jgi:hypothetical protein